MEKTPTFSIIVPIYNVGKYLRQCVESVLSQPYGDYELILVDDGSPDNSAQIIDEYAAKDPRVRPIHKQNGGVGSARIEGARLARGEYVIALDGDDYLNENALSDLADYIGKTDADVYYYGFLQCHENRTVTILPKQSEGIYETQDDRNQLTRAIIYDKNKPYYSFGMHPSVWTRAVKRGLYVKWQQRVDCGISVGEDLALTVPLMLDADKICVIQKPFYCYRMLENSMSHGFIKNEPECLRRIIKHLGECEVFDMNRHDFAFQLGTYCAEMMFTYLYGAAQNVESFKEFKAYTKDIDSTVWDCIKRCRVRFSNKRAIMATFITKYKLWHFFWIMAKIKG